MAQPQIQGDADVTADSQNVMKRHGLRNPQSYDKGVFVMAVLIEDVCPVGVTIEFLDAVTDEMGVDAKLPPGGIVHVHFEKDGRAHGVDVWDSVEAFEQFVQSTLLPTMGKVAAARASIRQRWANPR